GGACGPASPPPGRPACGRAGRPGGRCAKLRITAECARGAGSRACGPAGAQGGAVASGMGVLVAVGDPEGGGGETPNTVHIAAALGERGYRSLIIDLDPAAGAIKHLGVPVQSFAGTLELLTTSETPRTLAITEDMPRGVHLIPARPQLSELDSLLSK